MERSEAELIAAVLQGDSASFEPLVVKHSPRVFATARRYAVAKAKSRTSRRRSGSSLRQAEKFSRRSAVRALLMRMTCAPATIFCAGTSATASRPSAKFPSRKKIGWSVSWPIRQRRGRG